MTQVDNKAGGSRGPMERISSHVPGLDAILCGGFPRGGLYMIQGLPGMGKTVLGNQIIYSQRAESRALFVTVLGESHGRMLMHLRTMQFFDEARMPDQVAYINAYNELEDEGLKGLLTLLRREVQARKATLVVLDGMSSVSAKASAEFELKRFVHELQTLASATNCTMFLLTTTVPRDMAAPEHTMVDGLIELCQRSFGPRTERRLIVRKLRGSDFLEGEHAFHITDKGVTVFPRIEALLAMPTLRPAPLHTRVSSGIVSLDTMLGGGIPAATMTALVGPSGAGKTTLCLHFLSGSSASEPGLLFSCYEPPERLRFKATTIGLDLAAAEQRGELEILWHPVGEHILDQLAHQLLDAVRRRGVKRLVIDGISGFQQAALEPERIVRFWSALSHELRALGVTTLHTLELPELVEGNLHRPMSEISTLAEVTILVRYVELRSRLYRLISTNKVREGVFDPTIREFTITDNGVVVGKPFEGVETAQVERTKKRKVAPSASARGDGGPSSDDPGRRG